MKTQASVCTNFIRRLFLVVPVICSMAFAACSDVAASGGTHPTANLQSAVKHPQSGDYVTIGRRTYNTEARSFDRPWPFGPEADAQ
jgi:hypothetical protein